jgi:Flp pilus assembly protein TadG
MKRVLRRIATGAPAIPARPPVSAARRISSATARRTRGQSLVEFALILPVLLFLFAAVLDLGRLAFTQIAVNNAAREGAFQAAVTPSSYTAGQPCPSDGKSNVVVCRTILETRGSSISIAPSDISVQCNPSDCSSGMGNTVTVRVTTRFQLLTPIIAQFFVGSSNLTISGTSVAQIKTLPTPGLAPSGSASPSPSASASPSASPTPSPTPACSAPSAGFTFTTAPSNGKAPVTVAVTDTSTSGACSITSWEWNWGDGWKTPGQNPGTHTYTVIGTYDITLTVVSNGGPSTVGGVTVKVK